MGKIVDFETARQVRVAAGKTVGTTPIDTQQTEAVLFASVLRGIHGSRAPLVPILAGSSTVDKTLDSYSITDEEIANRRVLSIAVPPPEYEWLTINLENYDWEFDETNEVDEDPGMLLGRYYRLTLLTNYVLEKYGELDVEDKIFQDEVQVGGAMLDMQPHVEEVHKCGRQETATLQYAGGIVIRTMGLDPEDSIELRDYLQHSIDTRIRHAFDVVRFCRESDQELPPNLDEKLAHWFGVCLPLNIETRDHLRLWGPDRF